MVSKTQRTLYRKVGKRSMCRGKRIANPNKCKKIKQCKTARGKKRSYCRKKSARRYSRRTGMK